MDTSSHTIEELFQQLGLEDSSEAIDAFITNHPLTKGMTLTDAPYWSQAQAEFLKQALKQNEDWAEVVGTFDAQLRKSANNLTPFQF